MTDFFIFTLSIMLIVMSILMLAMLFELIYESEFYQRYRIVRTVKKWWKEYGKDTWGGND